MNNKSSFLPSDYQEITTDNYLKLADGDNTFRILSEALTGQEYWKTIDGKLKPVRMPLSQTIPIAELEEDANGDLKLPRVFWAFVVYNYADKRIQILEITQKTVRRGIMTLIENPKWGDPRHYDLTVNKSGQMFETKYVVTPNPKEELDPGILKLYQDMKIDLSALMTGGDPFNPGKGGKE